jgi:hypothetical protein
MKKVFWLAVALFLVSMGQAQADYTFTYVSDDHTISISGILVTLTNGPGPLVVQSGSFTGGPDGPATLFPGDYSGTMQTSPVNAFGFNNVLYPNLTPQIDYWGLLFTNGSGREINIYYDSNTRDTYMTYLSAAGYSAQFAGTFMATPVPIPAAGWLLGTALIGLVGVKRRFRK